MDKFRRKNPEKVIVAMSGGIDSSVAAVLLKKKGFEVIGVFMKLWSEPENNKKNKCCSNQGEIRARKVAKILKIPFYVFNLEKEFKKRIVNYFLEEYKKGTTPNPCVVCNKEIKFGLLLEKALILNANYIATGHYVRISPYSFLFDFSLKERNKREEIKLLKAKDQNKDQSYFLWTLNQKQLKRILFPIGDYTRKEVEKLAKKFKLPVLKAKKSVEICFIQTKINDFLKKYLKEKPGDIVDEERKKIGRHKGLWFYTIGQRKGIKLAGGPYWVLAKDIKRNFLIVTKDKNKLLRKELFFKKVNWISGKEPKLPLKIKAKIRYRSNLVNAFINKINHQSGIYSLKFNQPQRAITSGQSVVFYKGEKVLGGGIII